MWHARAIGIHRSGRRAHHGPGDGGAIAAVPALGAAVRRAVGVGAEAAHGDLVVGTEVGVGDALDFWRVLDVAPPHRLLLVAEMKTPGEALLEFRVEAVDNKQVELKMQASFLPSGIGGFIYWYSLYPIHHWLFFGMLKAIAKATQKPITSGPERFSP